jgi:hypothetical protein
MTLDSFCEQQNITNIDVLKIDMKIKAVVLTCPAYHETRVKAVRETWGKCYDTVFLSDRNEGNDIIGYDYLPVGYYNAWAKYAEFIKNEKIEYDWYFFTDDDTFVNDKNIIGLLNNPDKSVCYCHVGELNKDGTDAVGSPTGFPLNTIKGGELPLTYAGGGAGFIISSSAMKDVIKYINSCDVIPNSCYGDVTFGFWLRGAGVELIDTKDMNPSCPVAPNEDDVKRIKTYHYVTPEKMKQLWNMIT